MNLDIANRKSKALERFGLKLKSYGLLTMHREENVDFKESLQGALEGVSQAALQQEIAVLFLIHPRTKKRLAEFGIDEWARNLSGIKIHDAAGYLDFLNLLANARIVFTDSGGVQQEAYIHHVPSVTLRENTEWTETLENGANRLAGTDPVKIASAAKEALSISIEWDVPFGDGKTAERIMSIIEKELELR